MSVMRHRVTGWLVVLLLCIGSAEQSLAQAEVTGTVQTPEAAPLPFANVQLLTAVDSAFARGAVTGDAGHFALDAVPEGRYFLYVSLIGYGDHASAPFLVHAGDAYDAGTIVLTPETVEMGEVAVEARRALYEQRGDRMVINVGNSVTLSGASALDVLARSPGVIVNEQDGTVSMLGKDGVNILIDGKQSYVPAEGLVAFLEGLSADNVESIELITAPPADFDAEGNAGFINLVLKNRPDDSLSGSASISGGYGNGEVGSASTDARYRRGRLAVFGNYAFSWDAQGQVFETYRELVATNAVVETPSLADRDPIQRNHNGRLGIDYELTKRTTVGALVAAYDNRWSMDALNTASILTDGLPTTLIVSDNNEVNHWRHAMGNVNIRHAFAGGFRATLDFDLLRYDNDNPTTYRNATTDVASTATTDETLVSSKETPLRIYVAKADLHGPEAGAWSWSTGLKGALSRFTNDPTFPDGVETEWVGDVGVGEKSSLEENVLAAYGSATFRPSEQTTVQAGLRYEHTNSDLRADDGEALIDRRYGKFFPNLSVSHGIRDGLTVGASFVRRISRPTFNDMAPFIYFLNPYTFFTGSTALQPATLNALKADVTLGDIVASVQYAWEDDPIARFQTRIIPDANVEVLYPVNFDAARTATALLAVPIALARGWTTQNTGTVTWNEVEGERSGVPVAASQTSFSVRTTHNLSLPAEFAFEAAAFYQSASLFGAARFEPLWGLDLGLQRALPGNAGKLTLSVDDVFDSVAWSFTEEDLAIPFLSEGTFDFSNRTIRLTYSRRFGTGDGARQRETASEEESSRVQ